MATHVVSVPTADLATPADPFAATVQRQTDAAIASGTSTVAGGEPEELLAKLYDPLLSRLKAELRIDRDRCGSLTDLRR